VRVVVNSVPDCYAVLAAVHGKWPPVPGEFDDYIAIPKGNGYRSLHTAVIGPQGRIVEVQIRTHKMHVEAEQGVAAHWSYKEGSEFDQKLARSLEQLRGSLTEPGEDAPEAAHELDRDRIYVISPKGDIFDLPQGGTPLDFAYHVHTELGHRCRGAKVNGAIVPLNRELKSGDRVELLTVARGEPNRNWLNPHLGYLRRGTGGT